MNHLHSHAFGGKYKYNGETLCFLQDISMIAKTLPWRIDELDILIVKRKGPESKSYVCYAKISRVFNALHYKIIIENITTIFKLTWNQLHNFLK